ncbi:MAG: hypothetical protein HN413_05850 [Chloroflexi bacterium]|jgi:hypothetical protein|nr:hypothetical protein [Chloroflexota bacterium]
MRIHWRWIVLSLLIGLMITGCRAEDTRGTPTLDVYKPPTVDPAMLDFQATEAAKLTAVSLPTPTPVCSNNLQFLEDLSIEDGTVVAPGDGLDKRWKVRNTGTCNWNTEYEVRLVAGPIMGAPSPQALYPALSGTETEIRMVFAAPDEPGAYRSAWQAFAPDGTPFGVSFFIDIVVEGETATEE